MMTDRKQSEAKVRKLQKRAENSLRLHRERTEVNALYQDLLNPTGFLMIGSIEGMLSAGSELFANG
jgi:hypothetical protein